ncbi:MAG: H-NS histone family protein [Actinomycetaceae bacterium]|nr:H-NS histone family protein [Actinomycetaceae bacterium]
MSEEINDLLRQRQELEQRIKEARKSQIAEVVAEVRALIDKYDLTESDIFKGRGRGRRASTAKVPPKYKDPETGKTWTGRGKAPRWIEGKDRTQFLIA